MIVEYHDSWHISYASIWAFRLLLNKTGELEIFEYIALELKIISFLYHYIECAYVPCSHGVFSKTVKVRIVDKNTKLPFSPSAINNNLYFWFYYHLIIYNVTASSDSRKCHYHHLQYSRSKHVRFDNNI